MLPAGDAQLVQLLDATLADSARRSGAWLACRPGCNQCCTGVFRISPLDAERIREGLRIAETATQQRVRNRVLQSIARMAFDFPGNTVTGILFEDEEAVEHFEAFANDEVCPVLDPSTGTCDLYAHRPITCRSFGPPVRSEEDGFGVCELCFVGAPAEAVAAAELHLPDPAIEASLEQETGLTGTTIVAFALQGC